MIYQQQEIQRLHKATLNIRERIQKDTSKKESERSSREVSLVKVETWWPPFGEGEIQGLFQDFHGPFSVNSKT
jgi:hypothetical protein